MLDCDAGELRRRIESDDAEPDALQWRLDHIDRFLTARAWMIEAADIVIDTTDLTAEAVAQEVVDRVGG